MASGVFPSAIPPQEGASSSRLAILDRVRGGAGWFTEPVMAGYAAP